MTSTRALRRHADQQGLLLCRPLGNPSVHSTSNDWCDVDTRNCKDAEQAGALQTMATGQDKQWQRDRHHLPPPLRLRLHFGFNCKNDALWFGEASRAEPRGRGDAVCALAHEWDHAWSFNAGRHWKTCTLSTSYPQSQDAFVRSDVQATGSTTLHLTVPHAEALCGKRVPLTCGNYAHPANASPRDVSDLLTDLMTGAALNGGHRHDVSDAWPWHPG